MDNVESHIHFVKTQQEFHERQAEKFVTDSRRTSLHKSTAEKFKSLADELEKMQEFGLRESAYQEVIAKRNKNRLNLSWDEVQDLPIELREELSVSDSDRSEFTIVSIIEEAGGVASMDRILVDLFHQTGEVMKRATLNARLYRMATKELLYAVSGKKGVYSTYPLSDEEIKGLI